MPVYLIESRDQSRSAVSLARQLRRSLSFLSYFHAHALFSQSRRNLTQGWRKVFLTGRAS